MLATCNRAKRCKSPPAQYHNCFTMTAQLTALEQRLYDDVLRALSAEPIDRVHLE